MQPNYLVRFKRRKSFKEQGILRLSSYTGKSLNVLSKEQTLSSRKVMRIKTITKDIVLELTFSSDRPLISPDSFNTLSR